MTNLGHRITANKGFHRLAFWRILVITEKQARARAHIKGSGLNFLFCGIANFAIRLKEA